MNRKKTRPARGVKRRLTGQHLHQLKARLAAAEVAWELLDAPWFRAVDTDLDLPHPVHARVDQMLDTHSRLRRQRRKARELTVEFQEALPDDLRELWLDVDRLHNELALTHSVASYDLGAQDGRASMVVEGALAEGGIDTSSVEPGALFLLGHVLADIARRLPLTEGRAA